MILQALAGYYQRISQDQDSGIAHEGFESKAIPFIIVLDREGAFKGMEDTRAAEGKKKVARDFTWEHFLDRFEKKARELADGAN